MALFDPGARADLVSALSQRLAKRRSSAFSSLGEAVCRVHVEATVDALERDLEGGSSQAMRAAVVAFVTEFVAEGMGYSDLRFFAGQLRERARELASHDQREGIEQWCYEHLAVCTTHFMVKRDDQLHRQAAKRDIERYERQLAELEVALQDKTELLDMIRQASTPIAPVVDGILVVPLVGTFDRVRAELLTEHLLDEVARVRGRVTILDISGVPVFDTDAAQLIIRLARTVRLLGAKIILVGMSPGNAQTLVALGVALDGIMTCRALQDGLREALATQRLKIVSIEA